MLFNSWTFWIFFLLVLPTYWLLPFRAQTRFLLVASYLFYGWWDWRFLPLIAFSTVMDFHLGNLVGAAPEGASRQRYVQISVLVNLLLLGIFKYYNFFAHELTSALNGIGLSVSLPFVELVLPVGISFYTFQSMSYVLDIARGVTKPATNFWNFALYVSFFPHLVAGPIMRSGVKGQDELGRGLLKQLEVPRAWIKGSFSVGLYFILIGLFKKVVIGDNMASLVDTIFKKDTATLTGLECLAAVYAFSWQIYADFSGYSSIAQGVAKWMGVDLMHNFRVPYLAMSPSDFWRRWHISLSTWLRDYLYISLGGNRGGQVSTYRNLLVTMVLGGLWHGANWTFLLWGFFHGALLCMYRMFGWGEATSVTLAGRVWRVVLMFHFVCFGWLLFRAEDLSQVVVFMRLIFTDLQMTPVAMSMLALIAFYTLPLFLLEMWVDFRKDMVALTRRGWTMRAAVYVYFILMLIFFPAPTAHEFIYFQF
jgi:D-alanyl-lipoteichoic acid acyltransferase DltB (MBOAT superfamily)